MGGGTGGRQKGWDSQAETLRNEMGAEGLIWLLRQLSAGRQDWREAGLHGSKPSGEEGWQQAQVAGPGVSHHGWWGGGQVGWMLRTKVVSPASFPTLPTPSFTTLLRRQRIPILQLCPSSPDPDPDPPHPDTHASHRAPAGGPNRDRAVTTAPFLPTTSCPAETFLKNQTV